MDTMDPATIRQAPKVVLHDHLDGGLRPATVIALADEVGYYRIETKPECPLGMQAGPPTK